MLIDARQESRYLIAAPVSFWWPHVNGDVLAGEGITRNISSRGVLVSASVCPEAGIRIQMTIFLPSLDDDSGGAALHGEGVVLRVAKASGGNDSGMMIFAAAMQFYPEERYTSQPELKSVESVLETFVN